jgi:hypothetical protein
MPVVGFGSVRSCGVTTAVAALAAVWPDERRRVMVELDPVGGTLAAACGLRITPGLVSLATASRRGIEPDALWAHSQGLPAGGAAVVGPPSAGQAQRALRLLTDAHTPFADVDADVLADCGRLDLASPANAVFGGAEVQVVFARPQLPDLHHLAAWFEGTPSNTVPIHAARAVLVLVGRGPYPPDEIGAALGVEVAAQIPHDPAGVVRLAETPTARAARRSPLLRAARSLAATIVERFGPQAATPAESQADDTNTTLVAESALSSLLGEGARS